MVTAYEVISLFFQLIIAATVLIGFISVYLLYKEYKLEKKGTMLYRNAMLDIWKSKQKNSEMNDDISKLDLMSLPVPLTEDLRPSSLEDIVGQEKGIELLRTAICSKRPLNVIIYGPPGVGKTTAARLLFDEAVRTSNVFKGEFVEVDGTIQKSDERNIADPLFGFVHDPIYQGANSGFASNGVPEPKPGDVTKAHGGILFIDEIGELPPVQMNKLLKVLEDRRIYLSSTYYDSHNEKIPEYIHRIFKNGLPADFRLIGATTREPDSIPPALRSRCIEIFFRNLTQGELLEVATKSLKTVGIYNELLAEEIVKNSKNPRDVVNLVNMAHAYFETYGDIPEGKVSEFVPHKATIGF